jgi:NADPH:quinone reductase-like Zn-dependent oxidoreductase
LAPKPANLSFEQAAAVPISGMSALGGLRDAGRLQPGQRVLVIGAAGGVGTYAVQLAKAFGGEVTGVCSTSKAELVRDIGAEEVIDYTREDFTEGTRRFELILDTAGRRPLRQLRRALTPRGTLVIVGGEGGDRWLGGFQRQILAPVRALFTEQKMLGLISKERPEPGLDDERRRYYRLTTFGRRVALAEVERLEGLVRAARSTKGFIPSGRPSGAGA